MKGENNMERCDVCGFSGSFEEMKNHHCFPQQGCRQTKKMPASSNQKHRWTYFVEEPGFPFPFINRGTETE